MSTIELRTEHWQIPVRECDRNKLRHFSFLSDTIRTKNVPAEFQPLMDCFRTRLQEIYLRTYLDHIILLDNFESHLSDLQCIFKRFSDIGLHAKLEKCYFSKESVQYLGLVITLDGIKTNSSETNALIKRPAARNGKELISIIISRVIEYS